MKVEERVVSIIKRVANELPDDYKELNLFESGVLDSLAVMQMIGEIDDEFDVEIDVDDVIEGNFDTVAHIVALVEKYLK